MALALPGPTELYVVLALVLLVFGARKLPELARAMGSSIHQFRRGLKEEDTDLLEENASREDQEEGSRRDP